MTTDRQDWFRELEPPPGGAERLRLRLDETRRPPFLSAPRIAIAGALALAVAIVLFDVTDDEGGGDREAVAEVYDAAAFDRLLGRPIEPTDLALSIDEQAVPVTRIDNGNPKVRIYRVN